MFIGLPFVVRSVEPVLADLGQDVEEAAATLGASGWQTFHRIILPAIGPALLTGFALAFARGVGEYGSLIFIAGNMPYRSEEHQSELQSLMRISYAVLCLKKTNTLK